MDRQNILLRQFLMDCLDDTELTALCFDHFPEVYKKLTTGMEKGRMVLLLLSYCQRKGKLPALRAILESELPEPYKRYFLSTPNAESTSKVTEEQSPLVLVQGVSREEEKTELPVYDDKKVERRDPSEVDALVGVLMIAIGAILFGVLTRSIGGIVIVSFLMGSVVASTFFTTYFSGEAKDRNSTLLACSLIIITPIVISLFCGLLAYFMEGHTVGMVLLGGLLGFLTYISYLQIWAQD